MQRRLQTLFFQSIGWVRSQIDWPLGFILAGFIVLGVAYASINPLHEGTDELRHYRFVQVINQTHRLPVQGQEPCRAQSHHPPLMYLSGALATWWIDTGRGVCENPESNPFWAYRYWDVGTDNKNIYIYPDRDGFFWRGEELAARMVRLVNVGMGVITIFLTYLTARMIWPRRVAYAAGGTAFVAFSPMFLYMAGTINNDVVAAMGGAALIYTAVHLLHRDRIEDPLRTGFWMGIVYSVALMSKFSLAPQALILGIALLVTTIWAKQTREFFITGFTFAGTAAVFAGWWFVRNLRLYGDPTGFNPVTELWGVRTPSESWGLVWLELPNVWSSFWARFGFGQIPLQDGVYNGLWYLTVLSIGGSLFWLFMSSVEKRRAGKPLVAAGAWPTVWSIVILWVTVAIAVAVVIGYMLLSPAGAMGRFLFPGLPAFALLLFWGLTRWFEFLRIAHPRQPIRLAILSNLAMVLFAVVCLVSVIRPAYARPSAWEALPSTAIRNGATFDPFIKLHGYELNQSDFEPGDTVRVTMYWEVLAEPPGHYYFFAHVIDEVESMVTQRDTHPAAGKFPAGYWTTGDRFVDEIELVLPETTYPADARLQIGFYAPQEGYRLGVTGPDGSGLGDALILDTISLGDASPVRLSRNFEDQVTLTGYDVAARSARPGESVDLTLYFRSTDLTSNLSVGILLHSANGTVSQQTFPLDLPRATGQAVPRSYAISIPADAPAEIHGITVHLYDNFTQNRLQMIATRGNWIDNELKLVDIIVTP